MQANEALAVAVLGEVHVSGRACVLCASVCLLCVPCAFELRVSACVPCVHVCATCVRAHTHDLRRVVKGRMQVNACAFAGCVCAGTILFVLGRAHIVKDACECTREGEPRGRWVGANLQARREELDRLILLTLVRSFIPGTLVAACMLRSGAFCAA